MKKVLQLIPTLVLLIALAGHAQTAGDSIPHKDPSTDEQLAAMYYSSGDYDKALVYYEKLYNKTPVTIYYDYYLNCLLYTKNFKKAEKTVKRQSSRFPGDLTFHVDMGRVFQSEGDSSKARKEFETGISTIDASYNANSVIDLANAFLGIDQTDYAIKTLLKGRKELKES